MLNLEFKVSKWTGSSKFKHQDIVDDFTSIEAEENKHIVSETARQSAETGRNSAESTRQFNENTRVSNESIRQTNEQNRMNTFATNEQARGNTFNTNEATRQTNETQRIASEYQRDAFYDVVKAQVNATLESVNKVIDGGLFTDTTYSTWSVDGGEW